MLTRMALLIALLPPVALADERGSFFSLDRADRDSLVSVSLAGHFSKLAQGALREELYGRYGGDAVGVYAQVAFAEGPGFGHWTNGASDLELGLVHVSHSDAFDLVWRLGMALPTAATDFDSSLANFEAFADRIFDYSLIVPYTFWFRPGIAFRFGDVAYFAQLDTGIDLPIATGHHDVTGSVIVHANGGIGANEGPMAYTAELATDIFSGTLLGSVTVGIRYRASAVQPFIAYCVSFGGNDFPATHSLTGGVVGKF